MLISRGTQGQTAGQQLSADVSILMFVTDFTWFYLRWDSAKRRTSWLPATTEGGKWTEMLIISCLSSVSWNEDSSRVPPKILFAECLCTGCLINQQENHNYNSVPVFSVLRVLMKTRCQDDPNKYAVTEDFINVPVACTCVAPVVYEAWSQ